MQNSNYDLRHFVDDCRETIARNHTPADCVRHIVPFMYKLLNGDKSFLKPEHFRSHPDHYERNAIFIDENGIMSLYALVWRPGQWTPIHDHGTWGVVGVHQGALQECGFMRVDGQPDDAKEGIELVPGGIVLLPGGAVTSFVPNPDHIHETGNPSATENVVSLHLYGNAMAGFHIYDNDAKSRKWFEATHNES